MFLMHIPSADQLVKINKYNRKTTILIGLVIALIVSLPKLKAKEQKDEKIRVSCPRTPLGVIVDPYGYPVFTTTVPEHQTDLDDNLSGIGNGRELSCPALEVP
jgi:hypothetical protein